MNICFKLFIVHCYREYVPELDLNQFHLNFNEKLDPLGLLNGKDLQGQMTVEEAVEFVKSTYGGVTAYEFMNVEVNLISPYCRKLNPSVIFFMFGANVPYFVFFQDEAEREWLAREIERRAKEEIPAMKRLKYALEMAKSQNFDRFVGIKFPTLKRYGGEGAESVMAFYLELFNACSECRCLHYHSGMCHVTVV